jgi:hypothetical protein
MVRMRQMVLTMASEILLLVQEWLRESLMEMGLGLGSRLVLKTGIETSTECLKS